MATPDDYSGEVATWPELSDERKRKLAELLRQAVSEDV